MKEKTISQLLEEVANEICDHYCKYPMLYTSDNESVELLVEEHCAECPLNRI